MILKNMPRQTTGDGGQLQLDGLPHGSGLLTRREARITYVVSLPHFAASMYSGRDI